MILSAARCRGCGWVLYSRTNHDYRTCPCGRTSVDAGPGVGRRTVGAESVSVEVLPLLPPSMAEAVLHADWNQAINLYGLIAPDRREVVVVGQAPGPRTDPAKPLCGRSGARLEEVMGLEAGQLRERCKLVNVLKRWPGSASKGCRFPLKTARRRAAKALSSADPRRDAVVLLLGKGVAAAFGVKDRPYLTWGKILAPDGSGMPAMVVPHPSGSSRWWNDPNNGEHARSTLRALLRDNPAGAVVHGHHGMGAGSGI